MLVEEGQKSLVWYPEYVIPGEASFYILLCRGMFIFIPKIILLRKYSKCPIPEGLLSSPGDFSIGVGRGIGIILG